MTLHRWETDIETPKGTGQIRRKGDVIGRADYELFIETQGITARSLPAGDKQTRFTRKLVTGQISLLDGALLPGEDPTAPGGSFTLVLEDGREVDFYVESSVIESNPHRQVCRIQGSGSKL